MSCVWISTRVPSNIYILSTNLTYIYELSSWILFLLYFSLSLFHLISSDHRSPPSRSGVGLMKPFFQSWIGIGDYPIEEASEIKICMNVHDYEERDSAILKRVFRYYDVFEPPPSHGTQVQFLRNVLMPKVEIIKVQHSLNVSLMNDLFLDISSNHQILIVFNLTHLYLNLFMDFYFSTFLKHMFLNDCFASYHEIFLLSILHIYQLFHQLFFLLFFCITKHKTHKNTGSFTWF